MNKELEQEIEEASKAHVDSKGYSYEDDFNLYLRSQGMYEAGAEEFIKRTEARVWQEAVEYLKSQYDKGFHGLVSYHISSEVLRVEGKERGYLND